MNPAINTFKKLVIQIATPFSTGTGFYLPDYEVVLTNEHVIRGNSQVVIQGANLAKQVSNVLFTDEKLDLAVLDFNGDFGYSGVIPKLVKEVEIGQSVVAVGHPFGLKYTATSGIVSSLDHMKGDVRFLQHDAALNPGNSGGPLLNSEGDIIGVNSFIISDGVNIGFSLPIEPVEVLLDEFIRSERKIGTRCLSCKNAVFEHEVEDKYCPHCGAKVAIPSRFEQYRPVGVNRKIEDMLKVLGYSPLLTRKGPNAWEVKHGTAEIAIAYHEQTGLIFGDAYLCSLPSQGIQPIYEYLLHENFRNRGFRFSMKDDDVVLSLLIYDKYLNEDTFIELFRNLFDKADEYDVHLINEYGAIGK